MEGQGGLREVTGQQMSNAVEVKEKRRWMGKKSKVKWTRTDNILTLDCTHFCSCDNFIIHN